MSTQSEAVRVGDVLSLERRPVVVELDAEYEEIGIRSFGRGIFHKDPISGVALGNKRVFQVEAGDLVISNVFAWEGAVAAATQAEAGKIGSHRFMTFVPINARIDTSWAAWFFQSEPGLELIRKASPGSAGRNRTLAIKRFEALEIPLPPIEEQRREARRLERSHANIAVISARLARCESMASALEVALASAIGPTEEGSGQRWASLELREMMRPSAAQVTVDPVCEYRLAGIYSFGKGLIDRGAISGADTSYGTLTLLSEGDIVVSKLNGWEGAVAVVDSEFDGFWVSPEFPTFKVDPERLLPAFFRGIARAPWFWQALDSTARGSMVRRRRISGEEFLRAQIRLPTLDVQLEAARHIQTLDQVADRHNGSRERLDAFLPALLNQAFAAAAQSPPTAPQLSEPTMT